MISFISRLLRRLGLPLGSTRQDRTHGAAPKRGGGPAPGRTMRSDAFGERDDRVGDEKGMEPAMAGIPGDADQRMPRVASPGLPPVDPVVAAHATKTSSPAEGANARSSAAAAHGEATPESRGRASAAFRSALDSGSEVQAPSDIKSCANVAGHSGGDPCDEPSDAASVKGLTQGSLKDQDGSPEDDRKNRLAAISPQEPSACGQTNVIFAKDEGLDPEAVEAGVGCGMGRIPDMPDMAPEPAIDSRAGDRLHRVETPAKRSTRVPPRIADRPRMEEWADDELLTLPEAAALFWPDGPITTNTLRTAGHEGTLTITKVAGKFFTTPMAIRRMGVDVVGAKTRPNAAEATEASPQVLLQMKVAEAKSLGRAHARPRRAAKRSVAPAVTNGRTGQ